MRETFIVLSILITLFCCYFLFILYLGDKYEWTQGKTDMFINVGGIIFCMIGFVAGMMVNKWFSM